MQQIELPLSGYICILSNVMLLSVWRLFLCVKTRKLCLFLAWDSLLLILYYRLDIIWRDKNKICLQINFTFMETKSKKYRYRYSVSARKQIKILVLVSVCKKVVSEYRYSVSASTQIKILILVSVCKKVVSVHPYTVPYVISWELPTAANPLTAT